MKQDSYEEKMTNGEKSLKLSLNTIDGRNPQSENLYVRNIVKLFNTPQDNFEPDTKVKDHKTKEKDQERQIMRFEKEIETRKDDEGLIEDKTPNGMTSTSKRKLKLLPSKEIDDATIQDYLGPTVQLLEGASQLTEHRLELSLPCTNNFIGRVKTTDSVSANRDGQGRQHRMRLDPDWLDRTAPGTK